LDFRFWIVKALPVGSFTNSNVASLNPIGITPNASEVVEMYPKPKIHPSAWIARDWSIEQLPGLSDQDQSKLRELGITTTGQLLKFASTPQSRQALANQLQIKSQYVHKWFALADLARLPGVGCQYCGLLLHAGVCSVTQLAQTPVHRLHQQILRLQVATMQRRDLCPHVDEVAGWVKQARLAARNTL
jgi:predicted flap endonuclease-1-like 5' DNA nuclease